MPQFRLRRTMLRELLLNERIDAAMYSKSSGAELRENFSRVTAAANGSMAFLKRVGTSS